MSQKKKQSAKAIQYYIFCRKYGKKSADRWLEKHPEAKIEVAHNNIDSH